MKIFTVLLVILIIVIFNTFADENVDEIENAYFYWHDFNKMEDVDINFLNLNPLFFDNNIKFGHNYFVSGFFYNSLQNTENRNESRNYMSIQNNNNNDWLGFLLFWGFFIPSMILTDAYGNPQLDKHLNEVWERQKKEEELYQRIIKNYN
jgi:hypothetical protein